MQEHEPFYGFTISSTNCLSPANASKQTISIFAVSEKKNLQSSAIIRINTFESNKNLNRQLLQCNHKHSFRHQDKRHSTEPSKAYWNAIETGKHPNVKSNIKKRAQPYQNGSNSNLFLEEKIALLQPNPANTLNQRTKLVSKCLHKAKYKL